MPAKTSIPDETGLVPLEAARLFVAKLRKPAHILVAISGGSDSTGLLLALHEASIGSGDQVRLSAVTVDHALRPESADEAKKVATLCAGLGIFHAVRRWEDQKPASGLAEASRLARYHLIAGVADTMSADVIVTGVIHGATSGKRLRCAPPAVNGLIISACRVWQTPCCMVGVTGSCGHFCIASAKPFAIIFSKGRKAGSMIPAMKTANMSG